MKGDFQNASEDFKRLNPHLWGTGVPEYSIAKTLQPASRDAQREEDIHNDILDYCRSRGWLVCHGSMAHRTYRTEGEPDFVIYRDNGRMLLVEVKLPGKKLSEAQRNFKAHAEKLGHVVHVVYSFTEFCDKANERQTNERKSKTCIRSSRS